MQTHIHTRVYIVHMHTHLPMLITELHVVIINMRIYHLFLIMPLFLACDLCSDIIYIYIYSVCILGGVLCIVYTDQCIANLYTPNIVQCIILHYTHIVQCNYTRGGTLYNRLWCTLVTRMCNCDYVIKLCGKQTTQCI